MEQEFTYMGPKKKKGSGEKKAKKEHVEPKPYVTPVILPPITEARGQTMQFAVATSDCRSLTRMLHHYNFSNQLDVTDVNNSTPLHIAAKKGDVNMLKLLLSYGKSSESNKFTRTVFYRHKSFHYQFLSSEKV